MPSTALAFAVLKGPPEFAEEAPARQDRAARAGFKGALSDAIAAPWGSAVTGALEAEASRCCCSGCGAQGLARTLP